MGKKTGFGHGSNGKQSATKCQTPYGRAPWISEGPFIIEQMFYNLLIGYALSKLSAGSIDVGPA